MTRSLLFTFLICGFLSYSQGTAGIYKIKWQVDKRLTNRFTVENNGGAWGNMGADRLSIPQHLYDSVLNEVLSIVRNELRTDTRIIYPLSNNGTELRYRSSIEQVGGLPRGTKRRAMRTEYLEYYVKFKIRVGVNKGTSIGNEMASYSRLHPFVRVKMKAYGQDKRRKYRKTARQGNFKSLGSFEYNMGGVRVTNSNALPIEEIVGMVFQGLDKFKNKTR